MHLGTEFEYTDSESEIKIRKKSPSGLLRGKKGPLEASSIPPSQAPSSLDSGSGSTDKAKLGSEKGRKLKKFKSPKDLSFEFGLEASDDDLWNRRRSERIFLHDATMSSAMLTPAAPASSTPVSKPGRCGKGAPLSPKKEGSKAKERKELSKVRNALAELVWHPWELRARGERLTPLGQRRVESCRSSCPSAVWLPLDTSASATYARRSCQAWI